MSLPRRKNTSWHISDVYASRVRHMRLSGVCGGRVGGDVVSRPAFDQYNPEVMSRFL
jgi:hypothetical protein